MIAFISAAVNGWCPAMWSFNVLGDSPASLAVSFIVASFSNITRRKRLNFLTIFHLQQFGHIHTQGAGNM